MMVLVFDVVTSYYDIIYNVVVSFDFILFFCGFRLHKSGFTS